MNVRVKHYKKGSYIYLEQNNALDDFFILQKGEIKITKFNALKGDIEEVKNNGYIFGIKQCITQIPEGERVEAYSDCDVIIINKNQIEQLYTDSPKVILKILSEYSEILRNLDMALLEKDLLLNFMRRDEIIFDIADQYISINKPGIAAHLLQSYVNEKPENINSLDKAKEKLKDLPETKVYKTDQAFDNKLFTPNQVIFVEMEQGDSFYMIRSGKVKITNIRKGKQVLIAVLNEGSIFGEMAILNNKPRNATAIADSLCEVSIINKKSISNLPASLFYNILEHLTHRIWITEKILFCIELHNPVARVYYLLASKVKQNLKKNDMINSGYVFHYKSTIEELYNMANVSDAQKDLMYEFEKDENFQIYDNTIKIRNVKVLFDKSSFYLSRSTIKQKSHK